MSGGLANPAGAAALAAVAVLLLLQRLRRRRRTTPVSSLLLWSKLPARTVERQRFRVDLLFVLQLLTLLALIAGYVGPYLEQTPAPGAGAPLVAVLDLSASMQARTGGDTRFDQACARLRARLDALPAGVPAMIVGAAERARVLLPWTDDPRRRTARLDALVPADVPAALAPAVALALGAARHRPGARVVVVTDLPPARSGVDAAALAAVDWIHVGDAADNVAIVDFAVEQPPFAGPAETRATAVVRNFGAVARGVDVEARVGDALWQRRALALAPGGAAHLLLDAPPAAGLLELRVVGDDALAVDDRAVGWIAEAAPLDLLLVTDSDVLAAGFAGLVEATAGGRLEVMNRAGYAEVTRDGAAPTHVPRVTLFDRWAPDRDHGEPGVLYVAPPPGDPTCGAARMVAGAAVVDWDEEHPLLRGIDGLEALEVARASQLVLPAWGAPVVRAAARRSTFPLLVVGERDGRRRACLAAALPERLAGTDAVPLLVLTLATVRWLGEPAAPLPAQVATGVPAAVGLVPATTTAAVRVSGDPPVVLAERAGVHRLRDDDGSERLVLANLTSASESALGGDGGGEQRATAPPPSIPDLPAHHELGWWLYLAGAVLLAAEWAAWRRS